MRGLWKTARAVAEVFQDPPPACATCLDLGRNKRVRFGDPDEGRQIEGYLQLSALATSATSRAAVGASAGLALDGCPYCAMILMAVYLQAPFLIEENATVRIYFPVNGGVIIRDSNLGRLEMVNLQIYTPKGTLSPYLLQGYWLRSIYIRAGASMADIVRTIESPLFKSSPFLSLIPYLMKSSAHLKRNFSVALFLLNLKLRS